MSANLRSAALDPAPASRGQDRLPHFASAVLGAKMFGLWCCLQARGLGDPGAMPGAAEAPGPGIRGARPLSKQKRSLSWASRWHLAKEQTHEFLSFATCSRGLHQEEDRHGHRDLLLCDKLLARSIVHVSSQASLTNNMQGLPHSQHRKVAWLQNSFD